MKLDIDKKTFSLGWPVIIWPVLVVIVALTGIYLYAAKIQNQSVQSRFEKAVRQETTYLFTNLNDRLTFVINSLIHNKDLVVPKDQHTHVEQTQHITRADPFIKTINYINEDHYIRFVSPYDPNQMVIGLKIGLSAPKKAMEEALQSGKPALSSPFEIIQGNLGYSLMIPHPGKGLYEVVFLAENIFGSHSPFRQNMDIEISVADEDYLVYTSEKFEIHTGVAKYTEHGMVISGTIFNRPFKIRTLPSASFHSNTEPFWRTISIGSFTLVCVLLFATVLLLLKYILTFQRVEFHKQEEKYRVLFESLQEGIWVIDKDTITTFVNDKMAAMLGYSTIEMKGKRLHDFMDEQGVKLANENIERRKEGIREQHDFEFVKKDGSRIYTTMETSPLHDDKGNYIGAIAGVIDTTRRKGSEDALRLSELRLKESQHIAHIGTWEYDLHQDKLWWSDETFRIFGLDPTVDSPSLDTLYQAIHPDDRNTLKTEIESGKEHRTDYRIVLPGGEIKYIHEEVKILRKENGKTILSRGTAQNVTYLKLAKANLKESEKKFRTLFNQATDCILLMSLSSGSPVIVDCNEAALTMHGYAREELIGKPISFLDDPESADKVPERVKELKEKGFASFEVTHIRKDGTKFPVEVNSQIITIDDEPFLLAIDRDITDRKKAGELLKESEERYRNIFQKNHSAMLLIDPDKALIVDANPAALSFYGYSLNQITNLKISDINILTEAKVLKEMDAAKREGRKYFQFQHRLANGSIRDVEVYSGPLHLHGRELLLSIIHDITNRKEAEEALKISQNQLLESQSAAKLGNWDLDLFSLKMRLSEESYRLFDKDPLHFTPTFDEFTRLIHPEDLPILQNTFDQALTSDDINHVEIRIINDSGKEWVMEAHGKVIRDEQGTPLRMYGTVQDVTERKNAEGKISHFLQSEKAFNKLLSISLEDIPLQQSLERFLELVTDIPFLGLEKKGALFLVNNDSSMLQLTATEGIPADVLCKDLPFGKCLCGLAAAENKVIFASDIDDRHHLNPFGTTPHGHYCIPFHTSSGELLGVYTVYLPAGTERDAYIEEFLVSAGNILSGIVERKLAEKLLLESEDRFRTLSKILPVGVFVTDVDGKTTYLNERLTKITGLSEEEGKGTGWAAAIHPDDRERIFDTWYSSFEARKNFKAEYRLIDREGNVTWTIGEARPLQDSNNNLIGFLGSITDITELKEAEQKIQEAHERLLIILNSLEAIVYVADMETHELLFVNKYTQELFGKINGKLCWQTLQSDQSGPCDFCSNKYLLDENGNPTGVHNWQMQNTVTGRWLNMHDRAITWFDGRTVRLQIAMDITAQKTLEIELKDAKEKLEHRVEERTLELQQTHDQLLHSEKLSAVGALSASIAHEFNNPLFGVMNVLHSIRKIDSLANKNKDLVEAAIQECIRMKNLIRDLQDFNRPTSGKSAPIDIHACMESVLLFTKKEFSIKNISVEKQYAQKIPVIMAVADQLKQVFLNILTNAADACQGVENATITVRTLKKEDTVVIQIKDNGYGIQPKIIDHIFEPFFTTKPEVKGTGLGLSISYGIIKNHGGRIDVESKKEGETVFSIILPISPFPAEHDL